MAQSSQAQSVGHKRVSQVFRFLQALHQLRNPVQKQISEHSWTLWLHDLPDHSCIQMGDWAQKREVPEEAESEVPSDTIGSDTVGNDIVFKIQRPELTECPFPPLLLLIWLQPGWKEPERVVETIAQREDQDSDGQAITIKFEDAPERIIALQQWRGLRDAWAQAEVITRKAYNVFEKLYALHSQLQRESEVADLVIGDGQLRWKRADGDILYPVLIQRLQIEFRPSVPEFIVRETEDAAQFHTALFRAMSDVDGQRTGQLSAEQEIENYAPLEGKRTSDFLRRLAAQLAARGEFVGQGTPDAAQEYPRIGRDPVMFVRNRSQGFANALEAIRQQLPERVELPTALLNIVGETGVITEGQDSPALSAANAQQDDDVLFSKPANAEQLQIAQRLERNGCVLVQGPPGTGKTHTIANLLGHLLAQGKTVLVTSHTEKALRVVREQVVESLRPLCVSVLGNDGESNKQLENSVQAIVARQGDASTSEQQAARLAMRRADILNALREAQARLLRARIDEYRDVVVAGQSFAPSEAARKVCAGQAQDNWIPTPVEAGASLPLNIGELADLYATNTAVTPEDEQELSVNLPAPETLLTPADFAQVVAERERLAHENLAFHAELWNSPPPPTALQRLQSLLPQLVSAAQPLQTNETWRLAVVEAGMEGPARRKVWEELLSLIETVYGQAASAEEQIIRFGPVLSSETAFADQTRILNEIIAHLEKGGNLNKFTFLLHRAWQSFVQSARVGSETPHSLDHFRALRALADLQQARQELVGRWERLVTPLGGPAVAELGATPERACRQLSPVIQNGLNWQTATWQPLLQALQAQGLRWTEFFDSLPANFAANGNLLRLREALTALANGLVAAQCFRLQWKQCEQCLAGLESRMSMGEGNVSAHVVTQLREAVQQRDAQAYRIAWERLADLHYRHKALQQRRALLRRLEAAAPMWAAAIRERREPHNGAELPGDASSAWLWRQLNDELERRAAVSLEALQQEIDRLGEDLRQATAELIECRAWSAQLKRTTLQTRQALGGWLAVTKKIGGGKGKKVPRLLAEARRLLRSSREAVPVWITPLSRVVDNFDPRTTQFDVLIIDEASQCDLMGLIALYMAKSVVIVGDDEQVSPDAVAERVDEVQRLIDEHLEGVPNGILYDGQTSVYDLVKPSFGETLCLTEHFRCVPEIIQFSSHLSYEGKIKPLRDATNVRLKPHVIAHRVEGTSSRSNVNTEEAIAVTSLLIAATEQAEYEDCTFGIISLVGDEQARAIDTLLQSRMSTTEYAKRRIVCGNAAQFQGDERDVMFLSIVDGPQDGPLNLRREGPRGMWKKRYNVAASRARDQMWVVHSLQPDTDLKPGDIRQRLIKHAENPNALMQMLEDASKRAESEFERQVQSRLIRAGYRITPQWKVGGYRIDMVVEGSGKQLAVECDGDRYHPLDKLPDDMARQALLERLGWTFVRIRGSAFFRDPEIAMQPVFNRLNRMGIAPEARTSAGEEASKPTGSELQERVVRRAEELRRSWNEESERRTGRGNLPEKAVQTQTGSETPVLPTLTQAVVGQAAVGQGNGPAMHNVEFTSTAADNQQSLDITVLQ